MHTVKRSALLLSVAPLAGDSARAPAESWPWHRRLSQCDACTECGRTLEGAAVVVVMDAGAACESCGNRMLARAKLELGLEKWRRLTGQSTAAASAAISKGLERRT